MLSIYYRPAAPGNTAVIVAVDRGEDFEHSYSITPEQARKLAENVTCARVRNEALMAAERYVLDALQS